MLVDMKVAAYDNGEGYYVYDPSHFRFLDWIIRDTPEG